MINAIAIGQVEEFIMPDDKENPTIWIIGALDSITKIRLLAALSPMEQKEGNEDFVAKIDPLQFNLELVRFGLKGFKNFKLNGADVEFKTKKLNKFDMSYNVLSDDIIKMIPIKVLNILADKILGAQELSRLDEKN